MSLTFLILFLATVAAREIKTKNTKIRTERVELVYYDEKYVGSPKFFSFKYNRTIMAINMSAMFYFDVDNNMKTTVQAYKFASNEYRQFPVVFDVTFCQSFANDSFGMRNLLACSNIPNYCPMPKGSYYVCNWTPDYSKFPPNLVIGQFKLNMKTTYRSKFILEANWFTAVGDMV